MSGYEDGGPLSLSEAVTEALGQLGPGVLSDARAFVGALLDLADVDSAELRLLRAGLDDAALAPLAGLFDSEEVLVRGRLEEAAEGIAGRMSREVGADPETARRSMGQVADGIKAYLDGRGAVWVEPETHAPEGMPPVLETEARVSVEPTERKPSVERAVSSPVGRASEDRRSEQAGHPIDLPTAKKFKALLVFLVVILASCGFYALHDRLQGLGHGYTVGWNSNAPATKVRELNTADAYAVTNTPEYDYLTVTLPENVYELDGYMFVGWSLTEDGSDPQQPGTEVTFTYPKTLKGLLEPHAPYVITFFAAWVPVIRFDGNGGTGTMQPIPITWSVDGGIVLPECTFEKTGYSFAGWSEGEPGGFLLSEGGSVEVNEPTVFYANWVPEG